jgi:putative GTP pyrophosphokinase
MGVTMDSDTLSAIVAQYDAQKELYADFAREGESLIKRLLAVSKYRVHSVTSRLKERGNVEEKLKREEKEYRQLSDMTDIAGVRVITYFDDEVDRIGTLVEAEFGIDRERSVDKRQLLDADRFGYLSLHYICSLDDQRLRLAENARYQGLWCEVQIRSILQHAWAEIEHDLGYKPGSTVPKPIRRRFSRLAGLLEIGDQEFRGIRDELKRYEARVPEEVRTKPSQVEIDDLSLRAFVGSNGPYLQLVKAMADVFKLPVAPTKGDFKAYATQLRSVGLTTIDDLNDAVTSNGKLVLCQFRAREKVKKALAASSEFADILGVLFLLQVLVAISGGFPALMDFFGKFRYQAKDGTNEETAQQILSAIEACSRKA